MIYRKENWPDLLSFAISARVHMPFAWGVNDCVLCASALGESYTGVDVAAQWRGTYSTALDAMRIFHQNGGMLSMVERICADNGLAEIGAKSAMRGDLCVLPAGRGYTLAIVNGSTALAPSEEGLSGLPVKTAIKAWRVPFMRF